MKIVILKKKSSNVFNSKIKKSMKGNKDNLNHAILFCLRLMKVVNLVIKKYN